jgi:hypothetical protein
VGPRMLLGAGVEGVITCLQGRRGGACWRLGFKSFQRAKLCCVRVCWEEGWVTRLHKTGMGMRAADCVGICGLKYM